MARPAYGGCPVNHMYGCGTEADSGLPVDTRSCATPCSPIGCASMTTRYDIPNGVLSAYVSVSGDGYGYAEVTMQDDFTLHGLPAGQSRHTTLSAAVFCLPGLPSSCPRTSPCPSPRLSTGTLEATAPCAMRPALPPVRFCPA